MIVSITPMLIFRHQASLFGISWVAITLDLSILICPQCSIQLSRSFARLSLYCFLLPVPLKHTLFFILTLVLCRQTLGQSAATDKSLVSSAAMLEKQYAEAFQLHPQLFNGPEYVDYTKRYYKSVGHQFFLSPEKQSGSVYYNNHYFQDISLNYDVVLNQVVLTHANSSFDLRLINDNIRYFYMGNHLFTRLVADSTSASVIRTGYYEVLVDSTVQLLARRSKRMQERVEQGHVNLEFIATDKLFIKKAGTYYPVSSKGSVTRLFADHGKEVQKYIQSNKLKFKKASREEAIAQLTRYYNGLRLQ